MVQLFGTPAMPVATTQSSPTAAIQVPAPVAIATATPAVLATGTTVDPVIPATVAPVVAGEMVEAPLATEVAPVVIKEAPVDRVVPNLAQAPEAPVVLPAAVVPTNTTEATVDVSHDDFVVAYSDMVATSTNLHAAPFATLQSVGGTTAPMMARLATQPNSVLQTIYLILGCLVALALFASVILEWRQHRPLQTGYGLALLILMTGLFYVHTLATAGALVL